MKRDYRRIFENTVVKPLAIGFVSIGCIAMYGEISRSAQKPQSCSYSNEEADDIAKAFDSIVSTHGEPDKMKLRSALIRMGFSEPTDIPFNGQYEITGCGGVETEFLSLSRDNTLVPTMSPKEASSYTVMIPASAARKFLRARK